MRLRYLLPAILLMVPACSTSPLAMSPREQSDAKREGQSILPGGESVTVLNDRANNPANSQAERARAVLTLFARHIHPGASAAQVHRVLTDTTWLHDTHLWEIRFLAGWVPIELTFDDSGYCLHLFPDDAAKEWSPWVIYFRLSGKLEEEDALAFLRGERVKGNPKLKEFALCFPHSKNPTGLPGRIESFSKRGFNVFAEWR